MVSSCAGTSAAAGYGGLICFSLVEEEPWFGWCSFVEPFELGSCLRLCC
jgi:hypothetical protein